MSEQTEQSTAPTTAPAEAVRSLRRFVSREGGTATAVLEPVGEAGVRIVLVGGDGGVLGDRVVRHESAAHAAIDAVEGLTLASDWDRELVSRTTIRPSHWKKMAGWVARQRRFPKARNHAELD